VTGSNIVNNGNYAWYASSCSDPSTTILAENNWWGATELAAIERVIYHHNDYPSSPSVDFAPWADHPACECPGHGDIDADGFMTPLDLGQAVDILFAGAVNVQDLRCIVPRADFDCDGFTTPLDLGALIDHLFASGPPAGNPCEQ
jgi:hypothetical protein